MLPFDSILDLYPIFIQLWHFSAGWDWMFAFMPYGSVWREYRRTFHQFFNQTASIPYHPYEVKAVRKLLLRLIETPEEFNDHLLQYDILTKVVNSELT